MRAPGDAAAMPVLVSGAKNALPTSVRAELVEAPFFLCRQRKDSTSTRPGRTDLDDGYASFASSQSCRTASITRNYLPSSTGPMVKPLKLGARYTHAQTLSNSPAVRPYKPYDPPTRHAASPPRCSAA